MSLVPEYCDKWGVYEKGKKRGLVHICLISDTHASTDRGTFNLKTKEYVLDSKTKLIFIGTRREVHEFMQKKNT